MFPKKITESISLNALKMSPNIYIEFYEMKSKILSLMSITTDNVIQSFRYFIFYLQMIWLE